MSNTNYEQSAGSAPETVAEFDDPRRGFVGQLQHILHVNPAFVPADCAVGVNRRFWFVDRFALLFALCNDAHPSTSADCRHRRGGAKPRHSHSGN